MFNLNARPVGLAKPRATHAYEEHEDTTGQDDQDNGHATTCIAHDTMLQKRRLFRFEMVVAN